MKILLVQITSKNLGDSVIADNTRALLPQKNIVLLDYAINTEDPGQVRYVDAVIFAGGGLIKFRHEQLYRQVSELIREAEKYHVPVYLNAVGVEGFDAEDERCRMLAEALNLPCVRSISVRDDIECLKKNYITNKNIRIRKVYDPAICSAKTYNISRSINSGKKCIGLGVARDNLFEMYGFPDIDKAFLLEMWKEIAGKLEEKGYSWKIFTNGLDPDERFAEEVLEAIGHGEKLRQPMRSEELVEDIAGMDGMIACRMHSNIIAYSLGIPSIGLAWNEKLVFWSRKIGYPERCISPEDMKADTIVEALELALKKKTRKPSLFGRLGVAMELRRFVSRECSEIAEKTKGLAIEKHLVAPALGGCDFRYKNLNSIPLMKSAADRGYRYLELDVRLTNDGQLACVNGWGPATEKALGITIPEKGLMMGEFLQKSYYGRFPTSSFDEAILAFSNLQKEFPGIKLIVDAGRPETDQLDNFYGQIVEVLQKYCENPKSILIRLPRERDVKKFKEFKYHCKIVYSLPAAEEQQQKAIDFCKKKKIRMLSVSDRVWTPELQEYLKNQEFQTLILSYTKTGDVLTAISAGADLVASHYYDVDYIQQLLF